MSNQSPWAGGVSRHTAAYRQARGWLVTLAKFDLGFRALALGLNTVVYVALSILVGIGLVAVGLPITFFWEDVGVAPNLQLAIWSAVFVFLIVLWAVGLIAVLIVGWLIPGWLKRTFGIDPR